MSFFGEMTLPAGDHDRLGLVTAKTMSNIDMSSEENTLGVPLLTAMLLA